MGDARSERKNRHLLPSPFSQLLLLPGHLGPGDLPSSLGSPDHLPLLPSLTTLLQKVELDSAHTRILCLLVGPSRAKKR